ncbi:muscle M-line assembly protein unc-89 [Dendroctonus ponderosae]|nr:muscle M-line assembly protein unc-89 [Dendroctonus ponderosae]KAH1008978.1 hypothetical protein HUJ05_009464 [Dendroctonus ponderosae]
MEIITEIENQLMLIVPIGLAILSCILVYIYSIGPTQQPKFKHSAGDDRKTPQKKKKLKEKKPTANGNVFTGITKPEKSPVKETKKVPEPVKKEKKLDGAFKDTKKPEGIKKASEAQEIKKKTNKKVLAEKPADFDDGKWETVPSKADKKKKVEQPQSKKEKKVKHQLESQVKAEESTKEEVLPVVIEKIEPDVQVEPEPPSSVPKLLVEEVQAHVEEVAPIVEQKKDKKTKKARVDKVEKGADAVVTIPSDNEAEIIQPKRTEVSSKLDVKAGPSGPVSDELGDTWTEAKPVKKSKKKARRDN